MPRLLAWPLAVMAVAYGGGLLRWQARLPRRSFLFPGNEQPVLLDGRPLQAVRVDWRGPLAVVSWQAARGRRQRLAWWPDTLPPARRRELRLAAGVLEAAQRGAAMAP